MKDPVFLNKTLLLTSISNGSEPALMELYDECAPMLFGLLIRMTPSRKLAEMALEESFVRIWTDAGAYDPHTSRPLIWMIRIAGKEARAIHPEGAINPWSF